MHFCSLLGARRQPGGSTSARPEASVLVSCNGERWGSSSKLLAVVRLAASNVDHIPALTSRWRRLDIRSAGHASCGPGLGFAQRLRSGDVKCYSLPPRTTLSCRIAGFYVGVNAGGAFSTHDNHDDFNTNTAFVGATPLTGFSAVTSRNNDRSGFAGGGQIGYNYQMGGWVIGVEADIQGTSFGNNRDNSFFGSNGNGFATVTPNDGLVAASVAGAPGNVAFFNNQFSSRRNLDWFGTARGRIGYAGIACSFTAPAVSRSPTITTTTGCLAPSALGLRFPPRSS
jgi:hypothetical protein